MTDRDKRLPTLERILYDEVFGTDTRFGLGPEQIFVDPDLARSTIIAILNDPNREFEGVDIDNFINNTLNFSTPEDIVNTMNAIYDTFAPADVNFIFFEVLKDAFSKKKEFEEFFKTSWVALEIDQNVQAPEPNIPRNLNLQPGGVCFIDAPTPTPTPSVSPTPILSPTNSPTPTPTPSITPSVSVSPSNTPTPTPTPSITPSVSVSPSNTPTPTPTPTPTATPTPTVSITPTISLTPSITPSVSSSPLVTPTQTPFPTPTQTSGLTPTPTITATVTPTVTPTFTITPTVTPSSSAPAEFTAFSKWE